MFEELVSDVRGTLLVRDGTPFKGVVLTWRDENGDMSRRFSPSDIGAVSTWLAQPKPPTPEEIATEVVTTWQAGVDASHDPAVWDDSRIDLEQLIAEALRTALRMATEERNV